jgi:N-acetylneuraminic acid mutarotase
MWCLIALSLALALAQAQTQPQVYGWTELDAAPLAMGEVGAAILDDTLFVMGWTDSAALKTAVNSFDLLKGRWRDVNATAPRLFGGDHHTVQAFGGKLWVIGGLRGGSEGKLQIYDARTNAWTLGPDLPWKAGACASALIGGKLVVTGGALSSDLAQNGCAVLDPSASPLAWTACKALPSTGQHHMASGTDGTSLFVWGGRGFSPLDFAARFDPVADQWSSPAAARLPDGGRAGMGAAPFLDGKFFVMGGEGGTDAQFHDRVDIFDVATSTWSRGPALPNLRHGIAPVVHNGAIYVACGGSVQFAFAPTTTLFVLRPLATTTTTMPTTTVACIAKGASCSNALTSCCAGFVCAGVCADATTMEAASTSTSTSTRSSTSVSTSNIASTTANSAPCRTNADCANGAERCVQQVCASSSSSSASAMSMSIASVSLSLTFALLQWTLTLI